MALHQISHSFICPITQTVMADPVVCADGITYEREAITLWMNSQNISPVTNQPLFNKDLTPNARLRAAILTFQQQQAQPCPPSPIRGAPPLPTGWQPMSSSGRPVYVNPSSGEISHERPNAPDAQSSPSAPPLFMSRTGSAAFKQRAPYQYSPVWEWENDAGTGYNPFDPSVVAVLEPQFLRHTRERSDSSANFTYDRPNGGTWLFNFDFMMQTNPDTGGQRAIRRS